jgi:hypothetical protein
MRKLILKLLGIEERKQYITNNVKQIKQIIPYLAFKNSKPVNFINENKPVTN